MKKIINWLVPKEKEIFEMLARQSENALEGAKELKNFVANYDKFERSERKARAQVIKNIEYKGDEITHEIVGKLNKRFAAHIGKEDIHKIAVLLDDVTDLINEAALRFTLLGIERIDAHITKLSDIIYNCVSEVNKSIGDLKKLKDIEKHYAKIHALENEANEIYHEALSELFHFYKNSIDIIKYREIYGLLEETINKCEDVAHTVERIAVKHA